MNSFSGRHLTLDSFVEYLRAGVPINHPVGGKPRIVLFIDPVADRIGIRGPATSGEIPGPTGLEHLAVRTVHDGRTRLVEITVTDRRLFVDAYPVLCGVADRVQLDGKTMTAALAETLRRLGHLLRSEETLSRDAETGLIGELLLVAGFADTVGSDAAVGSWRGGQAEEHDFGFEDFDVEVKTTTSERRSHWISSITQLVPTGERALWLVSLQITTAGSHGRTLPELIDTVREMFPSPAARDGFDDRLRGAGWRDRFTLTCQTRWRARADPLSYAVTGDFPRLTPLHLHRAGVDCAHVTDVRYRLDLSGVEAAQPPTLLADAMTRGQAELL